MALNQKYTWADFLKENPGKQFKRTSAEGKKAFEAAFNANIKAYLKDRTTKLEKAQKKATAKRDATVAVLKATKRPAKAKIVQARVGQKDHAIAAFAKTIARTKEVAKRF